MADSRKIKPFRDDVLLKFRSTEQENLSEGGIFLREDANSEYEFYEIEEVGPDVKSVKVGDVVMMTWARMTQPFNHDGRKYAITSEKEIWAVIED